MGIRVIEGLWDEIASKVKLSGRHVRVVYEEGANGGVTLSETPRNGEAEEANAWLQQLIDFSRSHDAPGQAIDLDRDRLFGELHDDRG